MDIQITYFPHGPYNSDKIPSGKKSYHFHLKGITHLAFPTTIIKKDLELEEIIDLVAHIRANRDKYLIKLVQHMDNGIRIYSIKTLV